MRTSADETEKTGTGGRTYIAIDLKSFYASVECVERGLDPLTTNLVVADSSRTEKTICLAVSPSLKAYGISGRARLFEVIQKVTEVNRECRDPALEVTYITAPPRMQLYMDYSTRIYRIYLKYLAPEDIHVYSIDEVFMDVTDYLSLYHMTARELARTMIRDILFTTGITATCGIGTNLYLCKVAMDIVAKHVEPDKDGVRIAELDEYAYRRLLWSHTPLTDFWRVGRGYEKKLQAVGLYTMGDIARCSLGGPTDYYNEELLYQLFGVNAELLIDHAWGWEPTTIALIKSYRPESSSISSGQVLQSPYSYEKARLIVREMADLLALDLVDKGLVTDQIVLTIGYDRESLEGDRGKKYRGPVTTDPYGRKVPKHAHGSINLETYTSSTNRILKKSTELYEQIVDARLLVRRINITANHVVYEDSRPEESGYGQMDLFTDYAALEAERRKEKEALAQEKKLQHAMLDIKKRFGKNAILKGMNLEEGATTTERNRQVGGHKA